MTILCSLFYWIFQQKQQSGGGRLFLNQLTKLIGSCVLITKHGNLVLDQRMSHDKYIFVLHKTLHSAFISAVLSECISLCLFQFKLKLAELIFFRFIVLGNQSLNSAGRRHQISHGLIVIQCVNDTCGKSGHICFYIPRFIK